MFIRTGAFRKKIGKGKRSMTTIEIIEAILIIAIGIVIFAFVLPFIFCVLFILWELFKSLYEIYMSWLCDTYEKICNKIKGR
jgi:uncharacterized membrane protein YcaP (DUF421 family)